MDIKEILDDQVWSSLIVLFSQIVFIYLRTLNVIYTAERKIWPAIITGLGVGLLTIVSFSIGIKSFMGGEIIPFSLFLIGGAIGTYLGIKQNIKNENKKSQNK